MPAPDRPPGPVALGALVVVAIVAVAVGYGLWTRSQPSALDRFYEPPEEGVDEAARGDVLREEPMDADGIEAAAFRVLYRTVGVDGEAAVASGFVAWPLRDPPAGGFPIVAFGHPTVGLADGCTPSRESFGTINRDEAIRFLESGFAVAAADLPGLGPPGPHGYLLGEPTGASVVDAVRAAQASAGDLLSDKVVAWGYSQGGHAVLWGRAVAAEAAPELDWRGTVALAPVVDLARLAESDELGRVLGVAVALGQEQRGLDPAPLLTEAGEETRGDLDDECIEEVIAAGIERDATMLTDDRGWLDDLGDETPPTAGPGPALVVYGDQDAVVGTEEVAVWVERGVADEVVGSEIAGAEHGGLVEETGDDVVAWMLQRAEG